MNEAQLQFQLKKLKVTDDDIIVIKIPREDTPNLVKQNLLIHLRKVFPKNELLMVGSKMNLNVLPRKTLNAMGWFKINQNKAERDKQKISVDDEITKLEVKNFVTEQTQKFAAGLKERLNKELPEMNLDVRVETSIGRNE